MAYDVQYGKLSAADLATATDIAQKMEAIDGAITELQNKKTAALAEYDAKERALQTEKTSLREALRSLRTVSLTPTE